MGLAADRLGVHFGHVKYTPQQPGASVEMPSVSGLMSRVSRVTMRRRHLSTLSAAEAPAAAAVRRRRSRRRRARTKTRKEDDDERVTWCVVC